MLRILQQFLFFPWNKNGILLHVTSLLVVFGVGVLPREVRNTDVGVEHPANKIVHILILTESTVATLVSQNPKTEPEQTDTERLDVVKDKSQKFRFHVRNIGGSNVSNNKHGGDISEHVVQRPRKGSFKAVLWNSVQDLLETVVRSGEHVSVGVDSSFDIWVLGESSQVLGFRHSGRIHGNTCCNSGHRKKGGLFSGYKNAQGKNFHCNQ